MSRSNIRMDGVAEDEDSRNKLDLLIYRKEACEQEGLWWPAYPTQSPPQNGEDGSRNNQKEQRRHSACLSSMQHPPVCPDSPSLRPRIIGRLLALPSVWENKVNRLLHGIIKGIKKF